MVEIPDSDLARFALREAFERGVDVDGPDPFVDEFDIRDVKSRDCDVTYDEESSELTVRFVYEDTVDYRRVMRKTRHHPAEHEAIEGEVSGEVVLNLDDFYTTRGVPKATVRAAPW